MEVTVGFVDDGKIVYTGDSNNTKRTVVVPLEVLSKFLDLSYDCYMQTNTWNTEFETEHRKLLEIVTRAETT